MTFTTMNRSSPAVMRLACTVILAGTLGTVPQASKAADNTDWGEVAAALGKSGSNMPGGVYRVGLPRTDLHVTFTGSNSSRALPSAPGSLFVPRAMRRWSWAILC
jgi:hypothetical protein